MNSSIFGGYFRLYFITFCIICYIIQIHLENMYMGDEGLQLPCKFYDMPGIDKHGTIKKEDLDKILDGKIKLDVDVSFNLTLPLKTKRKKCFVLFYQHKHFFILFFLNIIKFKSYFLLSL